MEPFPPPPAPPPPPPDQPPAYDAPKDDDLRQPHTLTIGSRTIHQGNLASPPLYQLSHGLEDLRDTTQSVTLSRLDYSVKTAWPEAEPQVRSRPKEIFALVHPPSVVDPVFPFYAERSSRSGFGSVGMLSSRGGERWSVRKVAKRDADVLLRRHVFDGRARKDGDGGRTWEWSRTDEQGRAVEVVAVEEDGLLTFTIELTSGEVDVLVAIWCMRIWSLVIAAGPRESGWHHCEYYLLYRNEALPARAPCVDKEAEGSLLIYV
jgi:hypothetical protein